MSEDVRVGLNVDEIKRDLIDNLFYLQGKFPEVATPNDWYLATAYTVRDRLMNRWVQTAHEYYELRARTVCYFSAEFLVGPQLAMNLLRLNSYEGFDKALSELGISLAELIEYEEEPGLGTGGLGRLAACFMESLSTLQVPAIGYGIRYEFGIFDQEIRNGWQAEVSDRWLRFGYPWEIARPDIRFDVKFGGRTEAYTDVGGHYRVHWIPQSVVQGAPYDTAILGYNVPTANFLRLWKAEAPHEFDFHAFNVGDYYGAVHDKVDSENITKVLYPNDEQIQGRELRLKQQYFFVSCSLQDMLRIYLQREQTLEQFPEKFVVQLNDTHPSLAVPELMRLLVDEHLMDWNAAWDITQRTFSYTNHTLLSEALERWPVSMISRLLPRHLQIIYEINQRFLNQVRVKYPNDEGRVQRVSLIDESGSRSVRMAHLACVGSHAINGVAELHTRLLEHEVLPDFCEMTPEKFSNKTNGVTPRRFLLLSNPKLAALITEAIGEGWITDLDELRNLEPLARDSAFGEKWRRVKYANKTALAKFIESVTGLRVEPSSLFDIHTKRIHEYKRQHLNLLHVITLYNRIKRNPDMRITPRTVMFGGKAAPGYFMAKLIIKLINSVAEVVDTDTDVRGRLKVVFLPDFNVKNAQRIYPAADLSEQISTAGKEASGTGNMKMAMNGALTIGTLDGANIEIRDEVGPENFFLFGLTAAEVQELWARGYHPRHYYEANNNLREALDRIADGTFSSREPSLFRPIVDSLLNQDLFTALADYEAYVDCQDEVAQAFRETDHWTEMSILNVARIGKFSSDRAIREYCRDIWNIPVREAPKPPAKNSGRKATQSRSTGSRS
jgi:glycogen phosphorylase